MLTYRHDKHEHTVTVQERETTAQAILLRSGWKLVAEAATPTATDAPAADAEIIVTPKRKAKK